MDKKFIQILILNRNGESTYMGRNNLKSQIKDWLKNDYREKIFTKENINEITDMVENLMVNEGFSTVNAYHMACELIMGDESVSQFVLDMEGIVNEAI